MRCLACLPSPVVAIVLGCCLLLTAQHASAASGNDQVKTTLVADVEAVAPGSTFHIAVRMKIASHWHTYWINPGESGAPTTIKLTGPKGFAFGDIQWPTPTKFVIDGGIIYGYEDEVLLSVPVTVAKDAAASGDATIDADVEWLVCKDTCLEGSARLSLKLPMAPAAKPANAELFARWQGQLTVGRDHPTAAALASVSQPAGTDGATAAQLNIQWKQKPAKIEWFPVATAAVAIENVEIRQNGDATVVTFRPNVFDAAGVPGGKVDGVLAWTDASGKRVAVPAPVQVALKK